MINLIPKEAKKSIQIEYWVRALSVWLVLLSIVMVLSSVAMLPSHVLISSQVSVYKESADEAVQMVEDYKSVSKDLIKTSQQAKYVLDESKNVSFSEMFFLFENLEGEGVRLNEIDIALDEEGLKPISIYGVADDRVELASFRDRVLELDNVESVDLPISNLAKDKDISFKLTVITSNESGV